MRGGQAEQEEQVIVRWLNNYYLSLNGCIGLSLDGFWRLEQPRQGRFGVVVVVVRVVATGGLYDPCRGMKVAL